MRTTASRAARIRPATSCSTSRHRTATNPSGPKKAGACPGLFHFHAAACLECRFRYNPAPKMKSPAMARTVPARCISSYLSMLLCISLASTAFGQSPDTALATNGVAKITIADFESSILRIPEKDRFGWAMSQERVNKEIEGLLRIRMMAAEAKKNGLDADATIATRVKQYEERLLADALAAKIDAEALKEFDAKQAVYVERAREQFLINKQQYQIPAEVKASHILVRINTGRSVDQALAKAKALRARIVAGESFESVAETESDDPTARHNKGQLEFFRPGQMDAAFEATAFAMTKSGELSEPVRSQFGYHLIRFEERKPPKQMNFEDVKPDLLEKLKAQFLETHRAQVTGALYDPRKVVWNEPAVVGLRKTVDPALLKSITK
ncbi:MAG: peptidylprolyl isomerase [Betaproteobacteria bacterium]